MLTAIWRLIVYMLILSTLPVLGGCSSTWSSIRDSFESSFQSAPTPPSDTGDEVTKISALQDGAAIDTCLNLPYIAQPAQPAQPPQPGEPAQPAKSFQPSQDVCRDTIVQARLIIIDAQYTAFRQKFYGQARWGSFAATIINLGLTSASALTPVGTAHILGAAATGVTGSQAAYDKQVLVDETADAIETSMDAGRATVAVRIRQGLQQPSAVYPLAAALSDLEDYYNAGTLLGALSNINDNSGVQAQTANKDLKTISGFEDSPAALCLQAYIAPSLPLDDQRQHLDRFNEALNTLGITNQLPYMFATLGDPVQQQAVAQTLCENGK